ncbi:uncharacterized protein V2V93DRAFT_378475 [Kockiozyma suomiensis]|uniref:uncharacterized protein n=1 Tax=Kockiozyma suomiensis TaxID=1337062 RepID=UPI003343F048
MSAPRNRRRPYASVLLGTVVVTAAASLAYYYFSEPVTRWIESRGSSSASTQANDAEHKKDIKRTKKGNKRTVVVVMSEKQTIASVNLLTEDTKEQIRLLILYPTALSSFSSSSSSSSSVVPSVEELRTKYVTHPTHVFLLSNTESIKPILRHLASDESTSMTIVVADQNRDLKNDEEIKKFVGNVVVVEGDGAEDVWRSKVLSAK